MGKNSSDYVNGKNAPLNKQVQPMKAPTLPKGNGLPAQIVSPHSIAPLPKDAAPAVKAPTVGNIGKPAKIAPRTPSIKY